MILVDMQHNTTWQRLPYRRQPQGGARVPVQLPQTVLLRGFGNVHRKGSTETAD